MSARTDFLRHDGFALYTDVNAQVVSALGDEPLEERVSYDRRLFSSVIVAQEKGQPVSEANVALWAVVNQMAGSRILTQNSDDFLRMFGVHPNTEMAAARRGVFHGGFGDRGFPWYFSGAVASATVHAFVEDGHITERQAGRLTLTDWAGLIARKGFRRLMHTMAFSANGTYSVFGSEVDDHGKNTLHGQVWRRVHSNPTLQFERLFTTGYQFDEDEGSWQLTAKLHPVPRQMLRDSMRNDRGYKDSIGCPVARRSVRVPASFPRTKPHLTRLVDAGIMNVIPEFDGKQIQITQEQTAIDRTLLLIAGRLALYDEQYGTPAIKRKEGEMVGARHSHRKPTGVLKRTAEPPASRVLA